MQRLSYPTGTVLHFFIVPALSSKAKGLPCHNKSEVVRFLITLCDTYCNYKMRRTGRNGRSLDNWPFFVGTSAARGSATTAQQARALPRLLFLLLLLLLSFSARRANQSISFESSVLFPLLPPPPPSEEKERLGLGAPRIVVDHAFLDVGSSHSPSLSLF